MLALVAALGARGLESYTAEHHGQFGKTLATRIQDAIKNSDVIVPIITRNHPSPSVYEEVGYALSRNIPVIPLVESGAKVGFMLTGLEYMPFTWSKLTAACGRVASYILQEFENAKLELNRKTAKIVGLLNRLGPDLKAIAESTESSNESIRWIYQEMILNKGMAVQANLDWEALGFRRVIFLLEFNKRFASYSQAILAAMHELCYLVHFSKTIPEGLYEVQLGVPSEFADEVMNAFSGLEEMDLFTIKEALKFDFFHTVPMQPDFYDFQTGRWSFDWRTEAPKSTNRSLPKHSERKSEVDLVDLLILKELQIDGNKTLSEIGTKLGYSAESLELHFRNHIRNRLLAGFQLNWIGTRYQSTVERELGRTHRYSTIVLLANQLRPQELKNLGSRIRRLPFTWAEAVDHAYFAQLAFPVDALVESLQYLENSISAVRDRTSYYILDSTNSASFTLSYKMFNESQRCWSFDKNELLSKFEGLLEEITKPNTEAQ